MPASKPIKERFEAKVDKYGDCWIWTGSRTSLGYGHIVFFGKVRAAHRVAWELAHGSSPGEMKVCHRCDNRACVNPDHLFLGTQSENVHDAIQKKRFRAVLTEDSVRDIRRRHAAGGVSYNSLAREFGITNVAIRDAIKGHTWSHVD